MAEPPASLADAVEQIKFRLGVDPALKGKAAVVAARAAILEQGTLKEQVAMLCRELDIEYGQDGGGTAAAAAALRDECARLRGENEELRAAALGQQRAQPAPQQATPSREGGGGVAISFAGPKVQELREKAKKLATDGKYAAAVEVCTEGLKLAPQDGAVRLQRARACFSVGDHSAALDDATICTNADPSAWRAWKLQADAHMQLSHYEQAANAFQLAQRTLPPQFARGQSTELAKKYNSAVLMHQQQSSQGPRTPAKGDPEGDAQMKKKRRSSAYAHSGPGPKVMEEIRKMQTDVGDGSKLFDTKIDNPLLRSMEMATPRDTAVEAEHVDTYDSLTKRSSISRSYRICEPCRPTHSPGVAITVGHSEMSVGMEATGVELLTLPGGDVYVRLESQILADSERMYDVKGQMSVDCPAFHETARDFTRAYVSGSGDMLFL